MRILFATHHAHLPQRVGGAESSLHDLCLTMSELGHTVGVLSNLWFWPPVGAPHRLRVAWHGRASFLRDRTLGYPVFRARCPAAAAPELVRHTGPDVAVIQAEQSLSLAERFTASGVPCVVYLRDAEFNALGGTVHDHAQVRYLANSRDLADRFAEEFGIAPESIPPLVRPERYRIEPARTSVAFVCPLPRKGLEVAFGLAARRPDIPFSFVESWPLDAGYRRALEHRIRPVKNIALRRWTLDMRPVYRRAKLVVVPSQPPYGEGWGRVVSEAQVSGIPVIASRLGGLPESVGPGGILVDAEADLSAWESALAQMWDDHATYGRLATRALEHARRPDFQPGTIAKRFLTVLADVVKTAARPSCSFAATTRRPWPLSGQ